MLLLLPIASLALFVFLPVPVAGPLYFGVVAAWWYARRAIARSVRFPPLTGIESMAGRDAVAVTPLRLIGTVRYQGEFWRAAAARPIEQGTRVRIIHVERLPEGLTAVVEEAAPPPTT